MAEYSLFSRSRGFSRRIPFTNRRNTIFYLAIMSLLIFHEIYGLQSESSSSPSYPHQLISGVYKEKLPSPIFYDTFIPIIYEYQLPEWNKTEVTFNNWYTCLTETTPYKYTCPTVFHMNKAILNLHIDFESLQPVKDTASHSDYNDLLYNTVSFCNIIQKHFSGIYIQGSELNDYLDMLKKCHVASSLNYIERQIPDYNYTIRQPFSKMENNYYNTYYKAMNANNSSLSLDLVASATLSNARTTIQATLLSAFYAEKYRWEHALQNCQQQLLPHSLVTTAKLNETLIDLGNNPNFTSNYEFAIPLELLSKYYNLPLTDCTYTSSSFVVRLLFPIKFKTSSPSSLSLYQFRQVPFHYDGKLCQVSLFNEVEEKILADSESGATYSTICAPNSLCPTSELFQASRIDHCADGIVYNNVTSTKDNCEFDCKDARNLVESSGLITRVSSDIFVITAGNNESKICIKCDGKAEVIYNLVDNGALEIKLPCNCQLTSGTRVAFSEFPCNSESTNLNPELKHIEPWHLHFTDAIDNDSATDPMVLHYFLLRKAIYLQQMYEPSSRFNGDEEPPSPLSQYGSRDSHSSSDSSSHGALWAFLIISVLTLLTIQIFIIYQLRIIKGNSGGGPTLMQSMMFNVRGGNRRNPDPEPEFRLLNDQMQ